MGLARNLNLNTDIAPNYKTIIGPGVGEGSCTSSVQRILSHTAINQIKRLNDNLKPEHKQSSIVDVKIDLSLIIPYQCHQVEEQANKYRHTKKNK